jgi:hypothetical protein
MFVEAQARRLTELDVRIDRDAFECAHASNLRQISEEPRVLRPVLIGAWSSPAGSPW